jgi:hypothetical protein
MFIDTPGCLRFRAPEERNVFRGLISLLRSLDKFAMAVTVNVLLLRSLRCMVADLPRRGSVVRRFLSRVTTEIQKQQCRLAFAESTQTLKCRSYPALINSSYADQTSGGISWGI